MFEVDAIGGENIGDSDKEDDGDSIVIGEGVSCWLLSRCRFICWVNGGLLSVDNIFGFVHGCIVVVVVGFG